MCAAHSRKVHLVYMCQQWLNNLILPDEIAVCAPVPARLRHTHAQLTTADVIVIW